MYPNAIIEFGHLEEPLRNIRCFIDANTAIIELIPERLGEAGDVDSDELNPELEKILKDARPILESDRCLRLEFREIACLRTNMDVDTNFFGDMRLEPHQIPRLKNRDIYYPILEIVNSHWKTQLLDWQGGDDSNIKHYHFISVEGNCDVLGILTRGVWCSNISMNLEALPDEK